ncbi:ferrochelatase [Caulobacter sp. 17J80-11]|uniref:ferrochelatase n=1 Tax=Caulobacter sp. 17J80-11 TaxID=2763502 RepID=UPI0016536562|nr:ferrochelatase [Caulobacter sp. 17J80-11]MBC6983340.1 ferrochelatase [Caulobacter sp. 17J80-11]
MSGGRRIAVVLFNLGGPDGPEAVRPFLFNLFNDPAIIALPGFVRTPLARLIASRREQAAQANYAIMGGRSPLLPETEAQARALEASLGAALPRDEVRAFIAMRYWKPFTEEAARAVEAFDPDEVVLLPLYPQFSTTTTASSLKAWTAAYRGAGRVRTVCCYPDAAGLVEAHAELIQATWETAGRPEPVRLLFSAHGLPEKVIAAGDPYQAQVERTAAAVAERLGGSWDWQVCYQSRVGPLKWIGPSTVEAIGQAARDGVGVLISPIAFVSEHVETLVELDHEYAELARTAGVDVYLRAPALGVAAPFIEALSHVTLSALCLSEGAQTAAGGRWCGSQLCKCPAGEKAA